MRSTRDQDRSLRVRFVGISAVTLLFEVISVVWIYRNGGLLTPGQAATVMLVGSTATTLLIYLLVLSPEGIDRRISAPDMQGVARPVDQEEEKGQILSYLQEDWGLSNAETEVTLFAVKGFSNKEISELRGSSIATVKKQLSSVYRKSGMENRFQLIAYVNDEAITAGLSASRSAGE